uniref:COP9 signalosome complex subunit 8 n=1 Tax=Lygus hesperus TaxID=30085 RepID=A0A0A9ZGA0_LYGHE
MTYVAANSNPVPRPFLTVHRFKEFKLEFLGNTPVSSLPCWLHCSTLALFLRILPDDITVYSIRNGWPPFFDPKMRDGNRQTPNAYKLPTPCIGRVGVLIPFISTRYLL